MKRIITSPRQFRVSALLAAAAFGAALLMLVPMEPADAAFPGQNGKIAFAGFSDPNTRNIYTMNPDGSELTDISNPDTYEASVTDPAWSPDGTKIAFHSYREVVLSSGSTVLRHDIYTMNADGSNQTQITNNNALEMDPTWSPDGSKIAFVSWSDFNVYTVNANGSNQTQITNDGASYYSLDWSPDGTKLAVQRSSQDGNWEIYTIKTDGSNLTNLTNNARQDEEPNWSPDGTKIAFQSTRDGDYEIYTMNADGSNVTRLTNALFNDLEPAWSPDGTKIAFNTTRDGSSEIYTMNADGSNQTRLTNNAFPDGESAWGPTPDLTNTAPTITSLRPTPGSTTTDRTPTIAATIKDDQTDLAKANITLTLDGQTIPRTAFSYNRSTDRLTYTPDQKLSLGRHTLRLVAKDEANLSTTRNWGFEIVHP